MIQQDLPWNILKGLIIPIVNTKSKNVFNNQIGKIFSQFTLEGIETETNASNLYDAYVQYFEVNLLKKHPEIEGDFISKMNELVQNIYDSLLKIDDDNPANVLNELLKVNNIDENYKNWVSDFIIEREWIKIEKSLVKILIE